MSDELKPYLVSLEFEFACLASSPKEARTFVDRALDDICGMSDYCDVLPLKRYPDGWQSGDLVYHRGREDITIDEALKLAKEMRDVPGQMKMFEEKS